MTGPSLPHWLVLALIAAFQISLLRNASKLSRQDDRASLAQLREQFEADVRERARRGQAPDWLRYQAEADRLFESRDDRLRSLAAAALAVGLGGTLFALFVSVLFGRGAGLEPMALVQSMGVSLLGSLSGVVVNLLIVLVFLPAAEGRFSAQTRSLYCGLQDLSSQHPPQEAFTQTLREELGLIRQSLNTEFASAFSTAITGFPQVVTALGAHIERLAGVVEGQGQSIGGAVVDLARCAAEVANSGSRLQPAAEKLGEATEMLVRMPQDLRDVMDEARNSWLAGMREEHQGNVRHLLEIQSQVEETSKVRERQVLEVTRELQASVAEVRDAVGRIPDHLANEMAKASGRLGIEFGREARDHTNELAERLQSEYEKLLQRIEQHDQQLRSNIGTVVREILDEVSGVVQSQLVGNLWQVTRSLDEAARALPQAAKELTDAHGEWSRVHQNSMEGWNEVGRQTAGAADKLIEADGNLRVAVEALGASATHLGRVALATEQFEGSLRASNREAVEDYMAGLDVLRRHLQDLLGEMHDEQEEFVARQSEFIRVCIQHLMKGRQMATLERRT